MEYINLNSSQITNGQVNILNYYASLDNSVFINTGDITSFTNEGIILGGGGSGSSTNNGNNGQHGLYNSGTITTLYNYYGAFLGGGGGGYAKNIGNGQVLSPGNGGAGGGGGGGGVVNIVSNYEESINCGNGGSFINSNSCLGGTGVIGGGGGGGPVGNGGSSYLGESGGNGGYNWIGFGGNGENNNYSQGGGGYGGGSGGYTTSTSFEYIVGGGGGGGGGGGKGGGYYSYYSGYGGGNGGYGIYNSGTITTIVNGQGGLSNIYGPLFFLTSNNKINNYQIFITSSEIYGQIWFTGAAYLNIPYPIIDPLIPVIIDSFSINSNSFLTEGTYKYVLMNANVNSLSGSFTNKSGNTTYNWSLEGGSYGPYKTYDLVVTSIDSVTDLSG